MNEQDIVDAVTSALTGKFYVGQRVRIEAPFSVMFNGKEAVIKELVGPHAVIVVDGRLDYWNIDWLEPL